MKYRITLFLVSLVAMATWGCASNTEVKEGPLPKLGNFYLEAQDTVYHQIADFEFVNQMGDTISSNTVKGKVYVADFFFTSCPTICPIMKKEMLRVYEKYDGNPEFLILSHSIDPTFDTQEVLRDYSLKLGIEDASTWNFLTGDQEKIFEIGQTSYLTTAMADQAEPGGFLHSGAFILVDQEGHIRGVYDGTKADQVDRLLADIPKLLTK
jgi:protein SCO1/2